MKKPDGAIRPEESAVEADERYVYEKNRYETHLRKRREKRKQARDAAVHESWRGATDTQGGAFSPASMSQP